MTPQLLAALLTALLAHFPHMHARACIEARQLEIVQHLANSESMGVPAGITLSVAFHETWVGCHPGEGGGYGAPIDMQHRHTAGTPEHAIRALRRSFEHCGDWTGAVTRFRSGLCRLPPADPRNGYVRSVLALTRDLYSAVPGAPPVGPFRVGTLRPRAMRASAGGE